MMYWYTIEYAVKTMAQAPMVTVGLWIHEHIIEQPQLTIEMRGPYRELLIAVGKLGEAEMVFITMAILFWLY